MKGYLDNRICPQCGKEFVISTTTKSWMYKLYTTKYKYEYMCSYTCWEKRK